VKALSCGFHTKEGGPQNGAPASVHSKTPHNMCKRRSHPVKNDPPLGCGAPPLFESLAPMLFISAYSLHHGVVVSDIVENPRNVPERILKKLWRVAPIFLSPDIRADYLKGEGGFP